VIKKLRPGFTVATMFVACLALSLAANTLTRAQDVRSLGTESGFGLFQQRCLSCHGNPEYSERASSPSALRRR
jgi:mono/diheme cytochrome c family protein